jgi:hypothetical protein
MTDMNGPYVSDDDIHFDENMIAYHQGHPFSGTIWEDHPVDGRSEVQYKNGFEDGTTRSWYPSGILRKEIRYRQNVPHGKCVEYGESGERIRESIYDSGIWTQTTEFRDGRAVEVKRITPDHPHYRFLKRAGSPESSEVIDES